MNTDPNILDALVSMGIKRDTAHNVAALFHGYYIASKATTQTRAWTLQETDGSVHKVASVTHAPVTTYTKPKRTRSTKRATKRATADVIPVVTAAFHNGTAYTAAEVATSTGLTSGQVDRAIKTLRKQRKLFKGGDRRFTRYATTKTIAEAAAENAKSGKTAKGAKKTTKPTKKVNARHANGIVAQA